MLDEIKYEDRSKKSDKQEEVKEKPEIKVDTNLLTPLPEQTKKEIETPVLKSLMS